jgi:hypothetical protein
VPSFLPILHPIEHRDSERIGHDIPNQGEIQAVFAHVQASFLLPPRDLHLAALRWAAMVRDRREE